jgi:hypothetical protein
MDVGEIAINSTGRLKLGQRRCGVRNVPSAKRIRNNVEFACLEAVNLKAGENLGKQIKTDKIQKRK